MTTLRLSKLERESAERAYALESKRMSAALGTYLLTEDDLFIEAWATFCANGGINQTLPTTNPAAELRSRTQNEFSNLLAKTVYVWKNLDKKKMVKYLDSLPACVDAHELIALFVDQGCSVDMFAKRREYFNTAILAYNKQLEAEAPRNPIIKPQDLDASTFADMPSSGYSQARENGVDL